MNPTTLFESRKTSLLGPRTKEGINTLDPRSPRSTNGQARTDRIADYLCDKLSSPEHRNFFLKVAWRLPENVIAELADVATARGSNPRAYFITAAKRAISRL